MADQHRSDKERMWRIAGLFAGLGIELCAIWVVLVLLGQWVDSRWSLNPVGVLVGSALALLGTARSLHRVTRLSQTYLSGQTPTQQPALDSPPAKAPPSSTEAGIDPLSALAERSEPSPWERHEHTD